MGIERRLLAWMLPSLLLLSACGGNPAWSGPEESEDKVVAAAEQACACIYETIDREDGHDVDALLEQLPAWARALKGEGVLEKDVEEVTKLMARVPAIAETIDNGTCMQGVEDELFNKGIDFEDMLKALDEHCALSMFYD